MEITNMYIKNKEVERLTTRTNKELLYATIAVIFIPYFVLLIAL